MLLATIGGFLLGMAFTRWCYYCEEVTSDDRLDDETD